MKNKIIYVSVLWVAMIPHILFNKSSKLQEAFVNIYTTGLWMDPDKESISGEGSKIDATRVIRNELPKIIKMLNVKTLLDIPCGDFNWMKKTKLEVEKYFGADIVPHLIEKNKALYENDQKIFLNLDATTDDLPLVDLILCRDCLAHLSSKSIIAAIRNFKRSGARYVLISNFDGNKQNVDTTDGGWQPLNLLLPPYNFPEPLLSINEQSPRGVDKAYTKHLKLWALEDIKI